MSEFSELYDDEFFIIDSYNLHTIESRLYGFSIYKNTIVRNEDITDDVILSGVGTYIHIKEDDEKISIYQDLNGTWGLYLFKTENYFAISNSFLKLVEYLKDNHTLSFNEDFAKSLISTAIVTLIFRQTLVNEIDTIPRNYVTHIYKNSKEVKCEKIDYETHTVPLNSKEALDILDDWFYRWINLLRFIKEKTNNIEFNLSGGFDTRLNLILALCANIDLTKIRFRTFEDLRFRVHAEDYQIATEIANEFNFKLNQNIISAEKEYFEDIDTILNLAFYIKLGFHNQLDYRFFRYKQPVYNVSGAAAEMMRTDSFYYNKTFDEIFNAYLTMAKQTDESFVPAVRRILRYSLNELKDEFGIEDEKSTDLFDLTFTETRCRNHFGKFSVAEYLTNTIFFTPLVDPDIHKLQITTDECDDKYLFYAVIFTRYCPRLLDFKIEGNREISAKTLKYANKINKIKPFVLKEFEFISGPPICENIPADARNFDWQDVDNHLKKAFTSSGFKRDFFKYYPEKLHEDVLKSIETTTFFPLGKAYPFFHALKIINLPRILYLKLYFYKNSYYSFILRYN